MQNDFIPMHSSQVYTTEEGENLGWTEDQLIEANARIKSGSRRSAFSSPEFGSYNEKANEHDSNALVIQNIQHLLHTRHNDLYVFSMDDHPDNSISFAKNREMWNNMLSNDEAVKHIAMGLYDRYPAHCVHNSWGQKILLDLIQ